MITLEQIRQLEKRVHQAVSTISALKGENTLLKQKLAGYENRILELEGRLSDLKDGQSEIERGILAALDQLDSLEDQMFEEPAPADESEQFVAAKPAATKSAAPDVVASDPEPAPDAGQPGSASPATTDHDGDRASTAEDPTEELDIF